MTTNKVLSAAFEKLAQALRVLLEADWHAKQLLFVDRPEAVGNIEAALEGVWNSMHRLYDAMNKELTPPPINWYASAPLATLLVFRNARHHNHANGIRTIYSYHGDEEDDVTRKRRYVVVDFAAIDPTADTFTLPISWADIRQLLGPDQAAARISNDTKKLIEGYLACGRYVAHAKKHHAAEMRLMINVTPLIVNAMIEVTPHIAPYVRARSTEAKAFLAQFQTIDKADTHVHEVHSGPFFLPN